MYIFASCYYLYNVRIFLQYPFCFLNPVKSIVKSPIIFYVKIVFILHIFNKLSNRIMLSNTSSIS